ncbi:21.7 kDa class VI heat shock protein [Cucurbita pepo subsp. pepo]|uniref:21.7 kDa class VI heat shock protein n=1 Tax=Cucurbita pepo subsp. pepo TaxID=3664 RepID=UPI000C9D2B5E|nr:21.7 kDa class VI heat shock protein [Cucurbita pepo subsp. pepo]
MATSKPQLEVHKADHNPSKWSVALGEEVFSRFVGQPNSGVQKVLGEGSLFSPLLFGRFFDPADAFPLWEFEADLLMSALRSSGKSSIDWFQTDQEYVLQAELQEPWRNALQISVEDGKVLEISGQLKEQQREATKLVDWRCANWWEYGFVRRLELPEDVDCCRIEARMKNDTILEIKIPKLESNRGAESKSKDSDQDV